ncbi:MAG: sodium:proton antiporter [Lewinellaceae bacterium]|nr:sodium:proton antiporter [Saprospiraceae bacterium]MCB9342277.1 sodium:proton antiporter [Lewinellaceae bacterium]
MDTFQLVTLLIVLCATLAYLNHKFIKLPNVIGLLVLSLGLSTILWISNHVFHLELAAKLENVIVRLDFSQVLLEVMLSFMLFAGSFHSDTDAIRKEWKSIGIMAVLGTVLKTLVVAALLFYISGWLGMPIEFIYCLLFGALIAPTDPIAVLGILNRTKVPERIKTNIIGESLFNDGVGIVVFLTILEIVEKGTDSFTFGGMTMLFVREAIGGILYGGILGYGAFWLLKSIDDYETEILITLAVVMGGYILADVMHISGPLAMVVAGLITGAKTARKKSMSELTERYMDQFWELVDMGLNAILFLLIGLRLVGLSFNSNVAILGLVAIVIVLLARFVTIKLLSVTFHKIVKTDHKEQMIVVWSGLKGGLSLAMALSIPNMPMKDPIVFITYAIVLFSIIVQGLTVGRVANYYTK